MEKNTLLQSCMCLNTLQEVRKRGGEPNIHQQKSHSSGWARGALFSVGGNGTTFVFCTSE